MKKLFLISIIYIFFIFKITGDIKEVIVYQDRALVTRSKNTEGKKGINEIIFNSLPADVYRESLRANGFSAKGAGLKILDIRIEKNYTTVFSDNDGEKLKQSIQVKQDFIDFLYAKLERIKKQKDILEIFKEQSSNSNSNDLDKGKFSIQQWEDAIKFYEIKSEKLDEDYFKTNADIKKAKEELNILKDQYSKYTKRNYYYNYDIIVSYELRSSGNVEIFLSYIVPDTYWYPVYDCRLDLNTNKMSLEYYAKVYQKTGEDWNKINLVLSTARPDLSGNIPEITPWNLDFSYINKNKERYSKKDYLMQDEIMDKKYEESEKESFEEFDRDSDEGFMAEVESQGVALNYKIQQKADIPSGAQDIKVTVNSSIDLKPELNWTILPRYNESSFLTGSIKNESIFTFLPGEISVFVNDGFIGKSKITLINPNQEFELSFGRDPRIKAEFKLDDLEKGKKIGKNYELRKYLITIENNSNENIKLLVKDIIPRSLQPKKIIVKTISIDPEPLEIESESICKWEFILNKNQKQTIIEEWYLEYPEDSNIIGL